MFKKLVKDNKNKVLLLLSVLSMTAGYAVTVNAQNQTILQVSSLIEQSITGTTGAGGTAAHTFKVSYADRKAVTDFYQARGYEPLWLSSRGDTGRAREALALFEESWTHGLNPDTYHAAEIRALLDGGTEEDMARLELLTTDGAVRYGRDMTGMRIDPRSIRQRADYWRQPVSADHVLARLGQASNPAATLEEFMPNTVLYNALRKELVRLSEQQNDYERVLPLSFGGSNYFTPGSRHKDVAGLRVRLGISHDPAYGPESYYDDETTAALMNFQREHGLEPDGIIGPQTLEVLNRSSRELMKQVVANLERLRWLEQERPNRYFLVNIPQQLLWAVEDGRVVDEIKVVVGMPVRPTKDFKAEVTGVRFNPTWTVPLNLKMQDFVPKLQEDPGYLSQKGMEVIRGYGSEATTIDPYSVDWNSVTRSEVNQMRFVQSAGDHNALGAVRVLMANDYNIYMHDTNHPEFFERDQRTYSSGCIRLHEPQKVANFILRHNEGWSQAKMDELISRGRTVEVKAEKPLPVYIIYQSIWLDNKGRLVYGADIYKRDQDLIKVLARMEGFRLPESGQGLYADAGHSGSSALAYQN